MWFFGCIKAPESAVELSGSPPPVFLVSFSSGNLNNFSAVFCEIDAFRSCVFYFTVKMPRRCGLGCTPTSKYITCFNTNLLLFLKKFTYTHRTVKYLNVSHHPMFCS